MSIVFKDDKPVTCDCGCTVFSGWINEATITVMHRGKPKTIIYTYCDEDDHQGMAMSEVLWKYQDVEMHHIMTAEDKEKEKADERLDDED